MSEDIRSRADAALSDVEKVTAVVLPEPQGEVVPLSAAPAPKAQEITRRMAELDLSETNSIVSFGASAQAELQQISQSMLQGVRNKDVGPAGDSLRDIVTTIRGFSVSELDVRRERTFWEKLLGRAAPVARFTARFEEVQGQIDSITDDLLRHEHVLLKDIESLDLLYDRTLNFYDELGLYIAAGEAKLEELDATTIPEKEAAAQAADDNDAIMKAQELRDLRSARDDLERRVHDLKLTRQVTMQSLPSIRLVQENDKSLVTKINSTLVNTVPLWETQLAQAVTIQRSSEAATAVREANDLTNDLLKANARNLRDANKAIRTEMERGVFDIEAVKSANQNLIATIEESLQIADEGKRKRAEAEQDLQEMESNLRQTLASANVGRVRHRGTGRRIRRSRGLNDDAGGGKHRRRGSRGAGMAGGLRRRGAAKRRRRAGWPGRGTDSETVDPPPRSAESEALSVYYRRLQNDLLAQGLMRGDGGGPDTPFTDEMLARNFIRIALFDEYSPAGGVLSAEPTMSRLRRWEQPIRMTLEFGDTVPDAQRSRDANAVATYAARLSRLTGVPISQTTRDPNFHVLVLNEDDRQGFEARLRQIVPGIGPGSVRAFMTPGRSTLCLVIAFSESGTPTYSRAVALIRGEHPDMLRLSCIHEELAQGMGLANDSPQARPSIFNDDEEFGLLTRHDELLLQILYDDRLRPGMTAAEAAPIAREIATELVGGES